MLLVENIIFFLAIVVINVAFWFLFYKMISSVYGDVFPGVIVSVFLMVLSATVSVLSMFAIGALIVVNLPICKEQSMMKYQQQHDAWLHLAGMTDEKVKTAAKEQYDIEQYTAKKRYNDLISILVKPE